LAYLGICFVINVLSFLVFVSFSEQDMTHWPAHNAPLREDEALLFAFCAHQWPDDPYRLRPAVQYEPVVKLLNERFAKLYGTYSTEGVRWYIRRVGHDPRYRDAATGHRRYNRWKDDIAAFGEKEFGLPKRRGRGIDFYALKDKSNASVAVFCVLFC
jgi:hypothetical protein